MMAIMSEVQANQFRAAAQAKWAEAFAQYKDAVETWNYLTADWNDGDPLTPLLEAAGLEDLIPAGADEAYNEALGQECWDILGDEWETNLPS